MDYKKWLGRAALLLFTLLAAIAIGELIFPREKQSHPAPELPQDISSVPAASQSSATPTSTQTVANPASPTPPATQPIWKRPDSIAKDRTLLQPYATNWQGEANPPIAAFNKWAKNYLAATPETRRAMLAEGVARAGARREAMAQLIDTDPESALASAVPAPVRAQLPPQVANLLEHRVSGRGDFLVNAVTPASGQTVANPVRRRAVIDGKGYDPRTYGRRDGESTKFNIPLHGITVDGNTIALHQSPVRVLDAGEVPDPTEPATRNCPVSGKSITSAPGEPVNVDSATVAEVGHELECFCESDHLASYTQSLLQAEDQPGPNVNGVLAPDAPTAWTTGNKKVLVIRVDFSDLPGDPISLSSAQSLMNSQVAAYYDDASFHKTGMTVTVSSKTYRLPRTAKSYATSTDPTWGGVGDNTSLHQDARSAWDADAANTAKTGSFDRVVLFFAYLGNITGSGIDYGGLGEITGPYAWVNGEFDFRVCGHELGHTYGLYHSNLWQINSGVTTPVGSGSSVEYADPFDTMGGGSTDVNYHFNAWKKNLLGWLDDARVTTITTDGVYRIYQFDDGNADQTHTLAAVIDRNDSPGNHLNHHFYWIGFRKKIASSSALQNGAYILWGYDYNRQSDLLDMKTPGTNSGDSPLPIGTTFTDTTNGGITIKPLAQGGTSPNQYIDVQVSFGSRLDFSQSAYDIDEKRGVATISVTRSGTGLGAASVHYATSNGTASAPGDYTSASGTLSWASGDTSPKTITIPIVADNVNEGTETFTVALSNVSNAFIGRGSATVRINDPGAVDQTFTSPAIAGDVGPFLVLPDGTIVIGGNFTSVSGTASGGIAVVNNDGSRNGSFTGTGVSTPATTAIRAMIAQPDGKLIIAGNFTMVDGVTRHRIARLNADGSLDTTFDPGSGPDGEVRAIALQPNGAILIGGIFKNVGSSPRFFVARLNSNGSLDSSFTSPLLDDGNSDQSVETIVIQPDNNIFIGGLLSGAADLVMRLTPTGANDGSFANVQGNIGSRVLSLALQGNGSAIIGGNFVSLGGSARYRIARISAAGVVDTNFVTSVDDTLAFSTLPQPLVRAIAVQNDGKVLIGGQFAKVDGATAPNFARLNADGTLDTTFDIGTGSTQPVNAIVIQPDGRILISAVNGSIKGVSGTIVRLFSGLLPSGVVQFDSASYIGFDGATVELTLLRTSGSTGNISVNYTTVDGTGANAANAGSDFDATGGTVTWADGDTSPKTIEVQINADPTNTGDEIFGVNLGTPLGTSLGSPAAAAVTIASGDVAPNRPKNLSPSDSAANIELTPTLSATSYDDPNNTQNPGTDLQTASQWIVVRVSDQTLVFDSGRDTNPADFNNITLPSDFLSTSTTYVWRVRYQDSHSVWSSYSQPTAFTTRPPSAIQFSAAFYNVDENAGTVQLEVDRLDSTQGELQVDFATVDGSAIDGKNYTAKSGTLDFLDGENTKFITVQVIDNTIPQGDKRFKVQLSNIVGVGEFRAPATAQVLIRDLQISSFLGSMGSYSGLLQSGSLNSNFNATLTRTGAFTASFKYAGVTYKLNGLFNENGRFKGILPKSAPPLTLALRLNTTSGDQQITGTISDGSNTVATLDAYLGVFSPNFPATQAGKYTVLIPADPAHPEAAAPQGTGCGTAIVDKLGNIHFVGTLGDGTKASQGAKLTQTGLWPFFIPLYKSGGELSGSLVFENIAASDIDGVLTWSKPASPKDKLYPAGFSTQPVLIGSSYTAPAVGSRALPVRDGEGNTRISIASGGLASTHTALLTWGTDNKLAFVANTEFTSNFQSLKITVTPATGLFTGSFIEAGGTKSRTFKGAVFTKQLIGGGFFTGDGEVGSVKLVEVPKPL